MSGERASERERAIESAKERARDRARGIKGERERTQEKGKESERQRERERERERKDRKRKWEKKSARARERERERETQVTPTLLGNKTRTRRVMTDRGLAMTRKYAPSYTMHRRTRCTVCQFEQQLNTGHGVRFRPGRNS